MRGTCSTLEMLANYGVIQEKHLELDCQDAGTATGACQGQTFLSECSETTARNTTTSDGRDIALDRKHRSRIPLVSL